MVQCSGGLSEAEATIIRRNLPMNEDAEADSFEIVFCEVKQQGILKHATGECDGGKVCVFAEREAGGLEEAREAGVKGVCEASGRVVVFVVQKCETTVGEICKELLCGNAKEQNRRICFLRFDGGIFDAENRFIRMSSGPHFCSGLETDWSFAFVRRSRADTKQRAHSVEEAAGTRGNDGIELLFEKKRLRGVLLFRTEFQRIDNR